MVATQAADKWDAKLLIVLRPYQADGIAKIREAFAAGFKAPLYVAPTGSGKTRLFSSMAESAQRCGKRILILCHRIELVDQIIAALKDCDVTPDIIASGYQRSQGRFRAANRAIAVASVQTLVRRLDAYPAPTLIIIDESHHAVAGSYSAIIRAYSSAKTLGVTATPLRLDSRGLGAYFDKLIVGPSVRELIDAGYLAQPRVFVPPTVDTSGLHIRAGDYRHEEAEALMDSPAITGDALSHYRKHAHEMSALIFCTSVAHAHHVAERFRKDNISALALDAKTDKDVRRMAVQDFRDGKIQVLTNVDLFSEGVDIVGVQCGIFLRPTASLALYLQQCGRIMRPSPGKTHALLLDHVGNCFPRHGFPDDERQWTLTDDIVKRKNSPAPGIRVCPKCFAASPARSIVCRECGHVFEVKPRHEVEEREGELVELTPEQIQSKRERMMQGRSKSLEQLREFARRKGYSERWADHIWNARQAKKQKRMAS